jgi:hypothetical protein
MQEFAHASPTRRATPVPDEIHDLCKVCVAYAPQRTRVRRYSATLFVKKFYKKIEYTEWLEYTHVNITRRDASFSACVCIKNSAFAPRPVVERNVTPALRRAKRVNSSCFTLVEKPRCQTLKSRAQSAVLLSCLRNGNRIITGNVT